MAVVIAVLHSSARPAGHAARMCALHGRATGLTWTLRPTWPNFRGDRGLTSIVKGGDHDASSLGQAARRPCREQGDPVLFFRGDTDILECLVGWDALERLENAELTSRADRMARFEQHRPRIEAAALRKFERTPATDGPVTLGAQDVVSGPAA
ncbi:DUF1488 family protein [Ancylobacter dichloromethanicus]